MSTAAQEYLNPGFMVGLGYPDLKEISAGVNPEYTPGGWAFLNDAFGQRILAYNKVTQSGGQTVGQFGQVDAATAITDITSGTTTSLVTSGLTANAHVGNALYVTDNADSAGAAPEGEVGIVVSNTATAVVIDAGRPFSAALAANDDLTLYRIHDVIDAAIDAKASDAKGICFHGIGTQYRWGWYQIYGFYPGAATVTGATAAGADMGLEAAASVGDGQAGGIEYVWGQHTAVTQADQVNLFSLVFINVIGANFLGTAAP